MDPGYFCHPSVPWEWCPGGVPSGLPLSLGFRRQEGGRDVLRTRAPSSLHRPHPQEEYRTHVASGPQCQKLSIPSPGCASEERGRDQALPVEPELSF